jgi:hypothetical protein
MISRRVFLICIGLLAVSLDAGAQPPNVLHRVGVLAQDMQPGLLETFREELRRLGYVEGNSVVIDVRNASPLSSCGSPIP